MRLGEALVAKGIITEKQLAQALDAQLIFGAHLGTCLIELGFIDEHSLGRLLGEIMGVPYAARELLDQVPQNVTRTLTAGVADKHKAVPFELNDRTLRVAMVDPRNLASLDELSFVSGCRIEAWVAPEVRVVQALERYYDLPRRLRYIVLAHQLDRRSPAQGTPGKRPASGRAALKAITAQAAAASPSQAAAPLAPLVPILHQRALPEPDEVWAAGQDREPAPAPRRAAEEVGEMAAVAEELCRAEDATRAAKVLLNHAARGMERCILFTVDQGAAVVRETRNLRIDPARARNARIPINSSSIFGLLLGEPCYRGAVPEKEAPREFFETLGLEIPAEILLLPVYSRDRIVALLYGDGGRSGSIAGETEEFVRLARMFAHALDMIVVKRRIRST